MLQRGWTVISLGVTYAFGATSYLAFPLSGEPQQQPLGTEDRLKGAWVKSCIRLP